MIENTNYLENLFLLDIFSLFLWYGGFLSSEVLQVTKNLNCKFYVAMSEKNILD